jgi:hypothetical protein
MGTERKLKLISKYALLLSISYIIELAFDRYVNQIDLDLVTKAERNLINAAPLSFTFLLNLITSLIVFRDKVASKIETKYVIEATILYRPVGVVAFLIYSIYDVDAGDAAQTSRE